MQQIDNDRLVATLEQMVLSYEQQIAPLARDLAAAVAAALLQMLQREGAAQNSKDTDAEDDASFASIAAISTLKTVLGAVCETPHLYGEILPHLLPALDVLLREENADHLEDTISLLEYFSFYLETPFPAELWGGGAAAAARKRVEACMGLQLLCSLLLGSAAKRSVDALLQPCLLLVWEWVQQLQQQQRRVDKGTKRCFILFISSLLIYALEPALLLMQQQQMLQPVIAFVLANADVVEA
ncbi:hypothetical protein, conserved [Eimeria tenella]|uniref:MMS19 nucleotide excision repair protein n=1 Tax=Eimeria tenella TaxID=5802 RepID=U6KPX3_EIMTE|nr:hypothetical protein, conserved [Eimeria tenella]CDJ40011.1 hypothetical protein, conserved [Eimeria tenella]|eukprot:XP_013230764.1 hypothetical protein, conserved [Eimeria tenella]